MGEARGSVVLPVRMVISLEILHAPEREIRCLGTTGGDLRIEGPMRRPETPPPIPSTVDIPGNRGPAEPSGLGSRSIGWVVRHRNRKHVAVVTKS